MPEGPPTPPTKLHEALRPGKAGFDALRYASWHGKASPLVVAYLELLAERFPSAHDQNFIKRAAERGELARGLMRRLVKLAKQHGAESPELAEELGRAARSLAFWPGFPEAVKRLLAKVAAGEEEPVEGVGRFERIEATWSQRRGREKGEASEEPAEGAPEAPSPKAKGSAKATAAPASLVNPLAPFVRPRAGDHRLWNQAPSPAWVMHAAPGLVGWAGVLVPEPVSRELPAHAELQGAAEATPEQLLQLLQELQEGELGVLGVALPEAEGLEALIAWALRLLPLGEAGEVKLEVVAAVGPHGPSVKAAGQAATKALARHDAHRAKAIRVHAHPGKGAAPLHAQALAALCFQPHPEAAQLLGQHPWLGGCIVGAPWPTRAVYDHLAQGRFPHPDALSAFLGACPRVTPGALEALCTELLVEQLRAQPKLRRQQLEGATRALRLGDDLLTVGRLVALVQAADPEAVVPPGLLLGAHLARLEAGEEGASALVAELAQRLLVEDARLACAAEVIRAELHLAQGGIPEAEGILGTWLAMEPAIPGLAQWIAVRRTWALVLAAKGEKEEALKLLDQASNEAQGLQDLSSRHALQATLAMAQEAVDPKAPAVVATLQSLMGPELLLAKGEALLGRTALLLAQLLEKKQAEALPSPQFELLLEGEKTLLEGERLLNQSLLHLAQCQSGGAAPTEEPAFELLLEGEQLLLQGERLLLEVAERLAEHLPSAPTEA